MATYPAGTTIYSSSGKQITAKAGVSYTGYSTKPPTSKTTSPTTSTTKTSTTTNTATRTTTPTNTTKSSTGGNYYNWQGAYFERKADGSVVAVSDPDEIRRLNSRPNTAIMGSPYDTAPTTSATSQPATNNTLKNLSIGLAKGDPITQDSINSGALKPGGAFDYGGKDDLQNLSIGLAQQNANTPIAQEAQQQTETQNAIASIGGAQSFSSQMGTTPQISAAGTPTTSQQAVSAPMTGTLPPPDAQYTKIDGAYFQNTPQGLLAVSDPNIIQGLRTGQIKAAPQSSVGGGADRYVLPQAATPATPTTLQGLSSKFGLPDPSLMQNAFTLDPISTIKDMTQQIFKAMGVDQAASLIDDISGELEDLENDRDNEIRDVNDNPWLTEGVRIRQIDKVNQKYEDKINNRVNRLRLLESTRDDARQQAQFALGTAISMWDSQQRLQQQQIQMYYDQSQREFDNNLALFKMSQPAGSDMTSEMQEYMFSVEQGFGGSFLDYKSAIAAAGRAPSSGGGGRLTQAQINSNINTIAQAFDNEPIVKNYNTIQEGVQTLKAIGTNTKSPADDIAFIYGFAKIMDPNSVVREGEYNTIQKYAQTWADTFGFNAQRIYSNTNFLSTDAKQKMLSVVGKKADSATTQYQNLYNQYQGRLSTAQSGGYNTLTDYSIPYQQQQTYGPIQPQQGTAPTNNYLNETQGLQFSSGQNGGFLDTIKGWADWLF